MPPVRKSRKINEGRKKQVDLAACYGNLARKVKEKEEERALLQCTGDVRESPKRRKDGRGQLAVA